MNLFRLVLLALLITLCCKGKTLSRPKIVLCSYSNSLCKYEKVADVSGQWQLLTSDGKPWQGQPVYLGSVFDDNYNQQSQLFIATSSGAYVASLLYQKPPPVLQIQWIMYPRPLLFPKQSSFDFSWTSPQSTIDHSMVRSTPIALSKNDTIVWNQQMDLLNKLNNVLFTISTYNEILIGDNLVTIYSNGAAQWDLAGKTGSFNFKASLNTAVLYNDASLAKNVLWVLAYAYPTQVCSLNLITEIEKCLDNPTEGSISGYAIDALILRSSDTIYMIHLYSVGAVILSNGLITYALSYDTAEALKIFAGYNQDYEPFLFRLDINSIGFLNQNIDPPPPFKGIEINWGTGAKNKDAFFTMTPREGGSAIVQTGQPVLIIFSTDNQIMRVSKFDSVPVFELLTTFPSQDAITKSLIFEKATSFNSPSNLQFSVATNAGDIYYWNPQNLNDRFLLPSYYNSYRNSRYVKKVKNMLNQPVLSVLQGVNEWCFAAVGLQILQYVNYQPLPSLCEIVTNYTIPSPFKLGIDCCKQTQAPECQKGGRLDAILTDKEIKNSFQMGIPSFADFKSLIDNNIPVPVMLLEQGQQTGHVVLVFGYLESSEENTNVSPQLVLFDPNQSDEIYVYYDQISKNFLYPGGQIQYILKIDL